MANKKDTREYSKRRKPVYALILEGRNKTEKLYFGHFNTRNALYILKLISAEDTDPLGMAKKAVETWKKFDMRQENGDKVFCLADLDLSQTKYEQVENAKKKNTNIQFVLSNPCFEIWLLYYFTEHPAVVNSSQKVKDEMRRFVPNYTENMDVIAEYKLQDHYAVAINRAVKRQMNQDADSVVDRNPYTEVHEIVIMLTGNIQKD